MAMESANPMSWIRDLDVLLYTGCWGRSSAHSRRPFKGSSRCFWLTGRKIVLSGLRPTGRVHLATYFGAVKNWVDLQNSGECTCCFFFIADCTPDDGLRRHGGAQPRTRARRVLDWLAVGLDPARSTIFCSRVPQHAELALYFSMIRRSPWLERSRRTRTRSSSSVRKTWPRTGFWLPGPRRPRTSAIYRANLVPVGEDQASHLEICREIVAASTVSMASSSRSRRRCSLRPRRSTASTPEDVQVDGNTIGINEAADSVRDQVMAMVTDRRAPASDPATPTTATSIFPFQRPCIHRPDEVKVGGRGVSDRRPAACVDCKKHLRSAISTRPPRAFPPQSARERQAAPADRVVREVLHEGDASGRGEWAAEATMRRCAPRVQLVAESPDAGRTT
jgi:tryptophanyl-tRNA synthetase